MPGLNVTSMASPAEGRRSRESIYALDVSIPGFLFRNFYALGVLYVA